MSTETVTQLVPAPPALLLPPRFLSADDHLTSSLLDLQRTAPFMLAAATIRRTPTARDEVLRSYGMTAAHVQDGLDDFIPHSEYFGSVLDSPEEILDWTRETGFRETAMARDHLVAAGITQGMSFVLLHGERVVGSLHFNFAGIHEFDDAQYVALDTARRSMGVQISAYVLAGDVGLTSREREVLRLMADGRRTPRSATRSTSLGTP